MSEPARPPATGTPRRTGEMLLLFLLLPLAVRLSETRMLLPTLWLFTLGVLIALRRDPTFPREELWRASALRDHWRAILARFVVLGGVLLLLTWQLTPELLFRLPRERPLLFLAICIGYPILSVYPQGIVYRAFFLHRYAGLLGEGRRAGLLAAGAFAFLHLVFRNPIAVVVTLFGGLLFVETHRRSRSLFVSSFEHAIYGLWLMTTGWGAFLYSGTAATAQTILFGGE